MRYTQDYQQQYRWEPLGTLTTAQTALATSKSQATVDALTATGIIEKVLDDGTVALSLRFRGTANDADDDIINIYGMWGDDDHYHLMGTWTLTTGTQIYSTGILFKDKIVVTGSTEVWPTSITVADQENNSAGSITFNTHGVKKLLIIATTLAATDLRLDMIRL